MSADRALIHDVVTEMQGYRDAPPFQPTGDIDMVWVLAAPGTYASPSTDGPYAAPEANPNLSYDRCNIETGIAVVRSVTAARVGKPIEKVTLGDIAAYGPSLFYNGEDNETKGQRYRHNLDLHDAVHRPGFPLPASRVVIDPIKKGITPAQVEGYGDYRKMQEGRGETPAKHIAIASLFWHLPRVGRYMTHYADRFSGVSFTPVPVRVPTCETGMELAMGEARRVLAYLQAGHLARESAFTA